MSKSDWIRAEENWREKTPDEMIEQLCEADSGDGTWEVFDMFVKDMIRARKNNSGRGLRSIRPYDTVLVMIEDWLTAQAAARGIFDDYGDDVDRAYDSERDRRMGGV